MDASLLNFYTNEKRYKRRYMSPLLVKSVLKGLRQKMIVMKKNGSNCADVELKIKNFESYL